MLAGGRSLLRAARYAGAGLVGATLSEMIYLKCQYRRLPSAQGPAAGTARPAPLRRSSSRALPLPQVLRPLQSLGATALERQRTDDEVPRAVLRRHGSASAPAEAAAASGGGGAAAPPPRRRNILFVGDSLVTGVGCSAEGGMRGPAMPRAVSEYVARQLRTEVRWTAIGEIGFDVAELHAELLPAVEREARAAEDGGQRIDMVVLVCGLNDFKQAYTRPHRTASGFHGQLGAFVDAIHAAAGAQCEVVLPALPVNHAPVFDGVWPLQPLLLKLASLWDEQKQALALAAAGRGGGGGGGGGGGAAAADAGLRPAGERRVAFVSPGGEPWWSGRQYWAVDGIHPNDDGYRIWGEHIAQQILGQALLRGDA